VGLTGEIRSSLLFRWMVPSDFWHRQRRMGRHFGPGELEGYYADLIENTNTDRTRVSPIGVPLVRLRAGSYALHPVTVCQVALGWYERWLDCRSHETLDRFLQLADWLVQNQTMRPGVGGV